MLMTTQVQAESPIVYPTTRIVDHVDHYHGVDVPDPYRWLEADIRTSPEVAEWVAAENKVTEKYLASIPQRKEILHRLKDLWNFPQYGSFVKEGGRYFYFKNDGLQNQAVLYVTDKLEADGRVLIDPNTWSKDGTIALGAFSASDDGRLVAYSRSEAGSDWATWHILEVATGKLLEDELRWTKFTHAAWTKDSKGFFYSRYEEPRAGAEFQSLNFKNKVYYHRIGTPQEADVLVYWQPEHKEWEYASGVTDDGRYLIMQVSLGTDHRNRVIVRDLNEPLEMPIELIDNFDHEFTFLGNKGTKFFFKTDVDAPRRRVIAIDLKKPEPKDWRVIIPQLEGTLTHAAFFGNQIVGVYLEDVATRVKRFGLEGKSLGDVKLPGLGTAAGFTGRQTDEETFYAYSSIITPSSIYRLDLKTGESKLLHRSEAKFESDNYVVERIFYESKDGTKVPMFIAHRKGIKLDGTNPTLLYAYGGFTISLQPVFSIGRAAWLEMGGIYAQANLRGGGEYGEAWHKAGTKLQKQNVFDDFIAAAQWLIRKKYTSPKHLGIQGGSNGGLLVGAVMTQRPDLFGACLPAVGVMDMLRFHKFTEGRTWVDDYGSSDDPEQFKALYAYSPYHNLKPGVHYPATLVTTADTDDRVVPGHSFKFAAALQHDQGGDAPVLISISQRAGHGAGKPTMKRIVETGDAWAFLAKNLGMK
jgi:prolyl oligopeptidase